MIEKDWKKWIVLVIGVSLLLISTACMTEDATVAGGNTPQTDSGVPTPIVKQPGATAADGEQALPPAAPQPAETQKESAEPARLVPNPTAVVIDDITLPTPAYFAPSAAVTLGDPNAPMTVVEFSDYQCPYCAQFAVQIWPQVRESLVDTGEIYWILKDFPLDQIHPQARLAAQAAHCAGEQGAFWEMHDALFAHQQDWSGQDGAEQIFASLAGDLGLNANALAQCLSEGRYADRVAQDVSDGQAAGVQGTPSFFFNGYYNSGALPYDAFVTILDWVKTGELEQVIADSIKRAQATATPIPVVDVPVGDAPAKGDPNAPVLIVEYSEYQCPYCKRYVDDTLVQIAKNYIETGQVYYAFKDFTLDQIHPNARPAAMAAHCAGEQGDYWGMHDLLFEKQSEWSRQSNPRASLVGYAQELGIDAEDFGACLDSGRYDEVIEANLQEGAKFGVRGTPAFFVNGYFISGAQPYAVFEAAIESALAEP